MSVFLSYKKGSMKNLDEDGDGVPDTLVFTLINSIGTGSAYVTIKVFVDGVEFTDKTLMSIAGEEFIKLKPDMYVSSTYGDEITFKILHKGEIKPGRHKVKLVGTIDGFEGKMEFEDKDS